MHDQIQSNLLFVSYLHNICCMCKSNLSGRRADILLEKSGKGSVFRKEDMDHKVFLICSD